MKAVVALVLLIVALTPSVFVAADEWPTHPIKIIVPWPAGGAGDAYARPIAEHLASRLGQNVVVENRPGASGAVGMAVAAKSQPDGYTIAFGSVNDIALAPALNPQLGYDVLRDFVPVTQLLAAPHVLACHPSLHVRSMREFLALVGTRREELRYSSGGPATMSHVAGVALSQVLGIRTIHVPYKGGGPALSALVAGEVDIALQFPSTVAPMFEAGRLQPLIVMGPRRVAVLPGVPTAAEAGFPALEFTSWAGFLVPTGTPLAIVTRLHDEVVRVLRMPEIAQQYVKAGTSVVGSSPQEFSAFIRSEQGRWRKVVADARINIE